MVRINNLHILNVRMYIKCMFGQCHKYFVSVNFLRLMITFLNLMKILQNVRMEKVKTNIFILVSV